MTPLNREEIWSSVHGLLRSASGGPRLGGALVVGVSEAWGVSISIASSSLEGVALFEGVARLVRPFFLGAILCSNGYIFDP